MGENVLIELRSAVKRDFIISVSFIAKNIMYLLTEWENRTGKYLDRGHNVRTERSEVRTP